MEYKEMAASDEALEGMNEVKSAPSYTRMNHADLCSKRRSFADKAETYVDRKTGPAYHLASIAKDAIHWGLIQEREKGETGRDRERHITQYVMPRMAECKYLSDKQAAANRNWLVFMVVRYLNSEKRRVTFPPAAEVMVGGEKRRVWCDAAFVDENDPEAVTLVVYKIRKPDMTMTGSENAFERDIQLDSLILYGRQLGYKKITAAYYYLRKENDHIGQNLKCEPYFFGGGKNVVQKTDEYTGVPDKIDDELAALSKMEEDGLAPEEETEDWCRNCRFHVLCLYKKAPLRTGTEEA